MAIAMVIGLMAGLTLGFIFNITYPVVYSLYITMALLAAMDSVVGALRSHLEGKYSNIIFITGFFTNAALAATLAFAGTRLGIPLYYAVIFVFGVRLFNNFAICRRIGIDKYLAKKNKNMLEK